MLSSTLCLYLYFSVVGSSYSIEGGVVSNAITVTATTVREYECRVLHPRLPDYLNTFHNLIGMWINYQASIIRGIDNYRY